MKEGDKNIDQLFKESFDSFEPAVSDQLWSRVSENIATNSLGATSGALGAWKIVSIAVTCGIIGASIAWVYQEIKTETKKHPQTESNELIDEVINTRKIPLKEVIFTENHPIDEQDPLVKENTAPGTEFEIYFNEEQKGEEINNSKNQPSSIVNLFLTPRTKVLNNEKNNVNLNSEIQPSNTQVEIAEVIKNKLNPVIKASVSGGYVPLVVSFQQTELADEVVWDFGDGTILTGNYVEHIFREAKEYTVKVTIKDNDGKEAITTKNISVKTRCIISNVPNIFTPNGDGENDLFYVQGENIESFFIQVFNIEGKVVFETDFLDAKWDGNDAIGQQLSSGQYLYFIKAIGEDGSDLSRTGTLTLKR
jgi:gliding motility-associated-like protein